MLNSSQVRIAGVALHAAGDSAAMASAAAFPAFAGVGHASARSPRASVIQSNSSWNGKQRVENVARRDGAAQ